MGRQFKKEICGRIEKDYRSRIGSIGKLGKSIDEKVNNTEGNCQILLKHFYAYLPLSDVADYDFDLYLDYAQHAADLYEESPYSRQLSDESFINYVAVPRINTEDLTKCRSYFYNLVSERIAGKDLLDAAIELNNWCYEQATYHSTSERTASPITVYKGGYGRCGEESTFYCSVLRSVGIACRQVYVPRWSHSDSNHAWVEVFDGQKWLFTGACEPKPVFQNGWFTYAASRAMVIHNRCFSPFVAEGEEVIGKEGAVTINSSARYYSEQKQIRIKTKDKQNNNIAGAKVMFEIINGSELFPIATIVTDDNGDGEIKLGYGTVVVRALYKSEKGLWETEKIIEVADTDTLTMILDNRKSNNSSDWNHFTITAPKSCDVYGIELSKDQEKYQDERNSKADVIRQRKHELTKEQREYLLKYQGHTQLERAIKMSYGNFDEIKVFLDQNYDVTQKERMLACLSQKDLRDVRADVLISHMEAFGAEEAFYTKNGNCSEKVSNIPVDAENHADEADISAEFYHAANDFYAEYVVSPRIYIERLTKYRDDIRTFIGANTDFNVPEDIWKYIEENITVSNSEEYDSIYTTPAALLKTGRGTDLSRQILFVAMCRTYGFAAAFDRSYKKAAFIRDGKFIYAQAEISASARLSLVSDSGELPAYFEKYTLCYRAEDGTDITLESPELFMNKGNQITINIVPGRYRLINCNREASGNIEAATLDFDIKPAQEMTIVLKEIKTRLGEVEKFSCNIENIKEGTPVVFVAPGQEPTEHVLNELIELHGVGKHFEKDLILYLSDEQKKEQKTLQKVLKFEDWKTELRSDKDSLLLKGILGAENESQLKYPYVFYKCNDSQLGFLGKGYSVGIVDRLFFATQNI